MQPSEIKKKMMGLWENVFHDSKEYISLVFDNYFNEEYVEYYEEDGKIVSALLGIPYGFGFGENKLYGLYLCGLATSEPYRQKGIMSDLINRINKKVEKEFDFSFLIPASDLLAEYYRFHGYFNSFYRIEDRYTQVHDFKNDFIVSLKDCDERIRKMKLALYDNIEVNIFGDLSCEFTRDNLIEFLHSQEEKPTKTINICHSFNDFMAILEDNRISGGSVYISSDQHHSITGVAFLTKDEMKRVRIPAIYVTDNCSYYALLSKIKKDFADYSISVYSASEGHPSALYEKSYGAANPDGGDLDPMFGLVKRPFNYSLNMQPYGMIRFMRFDRIIEFIASQRNEANFKIHLKDLRNLVEDTDVNTIYEIRKGNFREYIDENWKSDRSIVDLSCKEFSELLLRKKDSSSLIMEAFGIPRLELNMCLMLD